MPRLLGCGLERGEEKGEGEGEWEWELINGLVASEWPVMHGDRGDFGLD